MGLGKLALFRTLIRLIPSDRKLCPAGMLDGAEENCLVIVTGWANQVCPSDLRLMGKAS